jgi:LysR family transcriptional activator of nhaA
MKVMASEGRGFIAVPTVAAREAVGRYGFKVVGQTDQCHIELHAITAERRLVHPAVVLLTTKARQTMLARGTNRHPRLEGSPAKPVSG